MPPRKQPPKKIKSTNGCFIITTLLIILVSVSVAATFYFLFLRPGPTVTTPPTQSASAPAQPPPTAPPPAETAAPPTPEASTPASQTDPTLSTEASPEAAPPAPAEFIPPSQTGPRLAIIIDDIGDSRTVAEQIIALDLPLTFSILPHTPHATHLASLAKARGHHILLHLPMEASDPKWPNAPGTLLLSMSKTEMLSTIDQDLDTPYRPIGINNHMGSKFTENPVAMRVFLNAIKAKNLFFIDSLTSVNSIGYSLAKDLGVKTAKRDIFLDNEQDLTKIMAQIGRAIALAQKHGSAIAIGHPHPATLAALRASQARLQRDVTLVPVHELVN